MENEENETSIFGGILRFLKISFFSGVFIFIVLSIFIWQIAPKDFYGTKILKIEEGQTLRDVSSSLKEEGLIRSKRLFEFSVSVLGDQTKILPGEYKFTKPEPVFMIAMHVLKGDIFSDVVKITIPEGYTSFEISKLLDSKLENFDEKAFMTLAKNKEGYLFPDTYFIKMASSPESIIQKLSDEFDLKTKDLLSKETAQRKKEIIIMASILEKEAKTPQEQKVISGILWKRIKEKMALQVDAPFMYILGKSSSELTLADLAITSAYNTYKNRGLPPTAISNPGIDAINAAKNPVSSPYYFYLHGDDGEIHYAKNFAEHKINKAKYIK